MPDPAEDGRPTFVDPAHDPIPAWRRTFRYHLMRSFLWFVLRCWFRFWLEGFGRLPRGPYVACINHPGWLDPMVVYATWPSSPRVYVYGPREDDMTVGAKNRLIDWVGSAVPFDPRKARLLTSAKRAVAVLDAGRVLVVAGEGRLTEDEDVVLPLNEGPAFFAIRAGVPLVAVAINGTRWLRFGKTIRVGEQGRAGSVEVYADVVDDRFDHAIEGMGEGGLVDVVLVKADADGFGVDLDQFGEGVLSAAGDGDRPSNGNIQVGEFGPGLFGKYPAAELFAERPWRTPEAPAAAPETAADPPEALPGTDDASPDPPGMR